MMIQCPRCSHEHITVISVILTATGETLKLDADLEIDGFGFDLPEGVKDGSTEDEVAQCQICGQKGSLDAFGFGSE